MLPWWKGPENDQTWQEKTTGKKDHESAPFGSFFGVSLVAGKAEHDVNVIDKEYENAVKLVQSESKRERSKASDLVQRRENGDSAAVMSIVGTSIRGKGNVDEDFRAAVLRIQVEEDKARAALDKIRKKHKSSSLPRSRSANESIGQSSPSTDTHTSYDEASTNLEETTTGGTDQTSLAEAGVVVSASKVTDLQDTSTRADDRSSLSQSFVQIESRRIISDDDSTAHSWFQDLRQYHVERFDDEQFDVVERTFLGCDSFSTSSLDQMICGVGKRHGCFTRNQSVEDTMTEDLNERDPIVEARSFNEDTISTSISRHHRSIAERVVDDSKKNAGRTKVHVPKEIGFKHRSVRTPTAIRGINKRNEPQAKIEDMKLLEGVVQEWKQNVAQESIAGSIVRKENRRKTENTSLSTVNDSRATQREKYYLEDDEISSVISKNRPEGYGTIMFDKNDPNAESRAVSPLSVESELLPYHQLDAGRLSSIPSQNFFGNVINSDHFRQTGRHSKSRFVRQNEKEISYFDTRVAYTQQERDEVLSPALRQVQERESNVKPRPESPSGLTCASEEPSFTTQQASNKKSSLDFSIGRRINFLSKDFAIQNKQRDLLLLGKHLSFTEPRKERDHEHLSRIIHPESSSAETTWISQPKVHHHDVLDIPEQRISHYLRQRGDVVKCRKTPLSTIELFDQKKVHDQLGLNGSRSRKDCVRPVPLRVEDTKFRSDGFISNKSLFSSEKLQKFKLESWNIKPSRVPSHRDSRAAYSSEFEASRLYRKINNQGLRNQVSSSNLFQRRDYRKQNIATLSPDFRSLRRDSSEGKSSTFRHYN